jgi:SAM-dependent methyltransferase
MRDPSPGMTPTLSPAAGMEDTGERMMPETSGAATFWEHIYRYRFAARFVAHKRVLDIACGEGYGAAALLRAGAASIIGVDISAEACEHARRRYGVDARLGSADQIPLPAQSVDVVVSFETIEHVEKPAAFLDECLRVLAPAGTLIISTPNREAFHDLGNPNPFHCSELTEAEFVAMLRPRFSSYELFTQRLKTAPWWSTRALAVELSPWRRLRGYHRLQQLLAPLCPQLHSEVNEDHRQRPVEALLARDSWLAPAVSPFAIRKRSSLGREQPYYLLAVARV